MEAWELYWLFVLSGLGNASAFFAFLSISVIAVLGLGYFMAIHDKAESMASALLKSIKSMVPIAALFLLGGTFIPNKTEMAAILIVPKITNNEALGKESLELYGLLKDYLKKEK